jgi:L-ascorbate metabolism protein UlaG (beta-lactamase superfamily)
LDLEVIVPIHWGTFDLLSGNPQQFKSLVRRGRVEILEPGKPLVL